MGFTAPRLPPLPQLMPVIAACEAARDESDSAAFEELAMRLTGATLATLAGGKRVARPPSARDERRVSLALRRIEAAPHARLSLAQLASEAATSPYHFLRIFRQVVGMTPHQFVLRTRLHHAAMRMRRTDEAISAIAFDAGFNDLSTFNRRFRRLMGVSPGAYRSRA
jgi:AraC-like DNA-binding protein